MTRITSCEETTEHVSDISSEVVDEVIVNVNSLYLGEMKESDDSWIFDTYSGVTVKSISIPGFESVAAIDVDVGVTDC